MSGNGIADLKNPRRARRQLRSGRDREGLSRVLGCSSATTEAAVALLAATTAQQFGLTVYCSARQGCRSLHHISNSLPDAMTDLRTSGVRRIINGGGPFLMETVTESALGAGLEVMEVPLMSLGSEHEDRKNPLGSKAIWTVRSLCLGTRCSTFTAVGDAYLVLPGGLGSVYELMHILQRVQLERDHGQDSATPYWHRRHAGRQHEGKLLLPLIVVVGAMWQPVRMLLDEMVAEGTIKPEDPGLVTFVDSLPEAVTRICSHATLWLSCPRLH